MNKPINFKLAKLLKEKGYDEDCYRTYSNGKISPFPLLENMSGEPILNPLDYKWKNSLIHESLVSAPTIAEVMQWLYENHNIWIDVFVDDDRTFGYMISKFIEEGRLDSPIKRFFTNSTEAYENAIEKVLTGVIQNLD